SMISGYCVQRLLLSTDAIALRHLHEAEHADAVSIIAHRPGQQVGQLAARAARHRRHLLVGREELDVVNDSEGEPRAARLFEARAADDRRIAGRAMRAGLHRAPPVSLRSRDCRLARAPKATPQPCLPTSLPAWRRSSRRDKS